MVKLKSIFRTFYSCHQELGDRNGMMTDDNIATSQIPLQQSSLLRLWHQRKRLITGFLLLRATRRVPHVVQELLVRPEYLSSRQFLMGCVIFSCQRILFNGLGRLFVVLGYFFMSRLVLFSEM